MTKSHYYPKLELEKVIQVEKFSHPALELTLDKALELFNGVYQATKQGEIVLNPEFIIPGNNEKFRALLLLSNTAHVSYDYLNGNLSPSEFSDDFRLGVLAGKGSWFVHHGQAIDVDGDPTVLYVPQYAQKLEQKYQIERDWRTIDDSITKLKKIIDKAGEWKGGVDFPDYKKD